MKKLALLFSMILVAHTLFAQDTTSYKKRLSEMMAVSGAKATYTAVINQMVMNFKKEKPEIPVVFWDKFGEAFTERATSDIIDLVLPIYERHLTEEDLKNMIIFYKSPTGMKMAKETPFIMQESMQAGRAWGMKIGQEFMQKLKDEGYEKN